MCADPNIYVKYFQNGLACGKRDEKAHGGLRRLIACLESCDMHQAKRIGSQGCCRRNTFIGKANDRRGQSHVGQLDQRSDI